ncbi:unnamed protein product [Ostreobium quekettii]|uniref:Uncharacterized protein n=1 Tax=Ostreobium quekettii TaxID=121088 RepID=A0A8S1IP45_9CHLO|nr:unnamed protein product [Ostreobium quekettii]
MAILDGDPGVGVRRPTDALLRENPLFRQLWACVVNALQSPGGYSANAVGLMAVATAPAACLPGGSLAASLFLCEPKGALRAIFVRFGLSAMDHASEDWRCRPARCGPSGVLSLWMCAGSTVLQGRCKQRDGRELPLGGLRHKESRTLSLMTWDEG